MARVFNAYAVAKEVIRGNLNKYTRKAFEMLPVIEEPGILDIGCGSGVPTLELAGICSGQITGLDIDQDKLDQLERKVKEQNLADRVKTVKGSLLDMDFPDESFDIIWAEGSIAIIGFERGLKEWRRCIRAGGFLVLHDDLGDLAKKLGLIADRGYELLHYFLLHEDVWWDEYYAPLERLIIKTKAGHTAKITSPELISDEGEIDLIKKEPARFRSAFFIMKKTS